MSLRDTPPPTSTSWLESDQRPQPETTSGGSFPVGAFRNPSDDEIKELQERHNAQLEATSLSMADELTDAFLGNNVSPIVDIARATGSENAARYAAEISYLVKEAINFTIESLEGKGE